MKGDPKTPTAEWIESWKDQADALCMVVRMAQAQKVTWDKLGPRIGQDLLAILVRFPIVCEEAIKRAKSSDAGRHTFSTQSSQNKVDADRRVLIAFDLWQQRNEAALRSNDKPYPVAERVRRYLRVKSDLSERDRRRIRALLKAGKVLPL